MDNNGPAFIVLVKTSSNLFLMMTKTEDKKYMIEAFPTETEAVRFFEDGWKECLDRDRTWQTSVLINFMFFQPSIIQVPNVDFIKKLLQDKPTITSYRNMAGWYFGIALISHEAQKLWDAGTKPRLIT